MQTFKFNFRLSNCQLNPIPNSFWGLVIVRKHIDVSFLCVRPLIDDTFRHNIVKVCCRTSRLRPVAPQPLLQYYDAIYHQ